MYRKSLTVQPLKAIAKRTTIYLPSQYKLDKPTQEINEKLNSFNQLLCIDNCPVSVHHIFNIFNSFHTNTENRNSFQVVISEHHRQSLAMIRQQTGLTISKIIEYCFKIVPKQKGLKVTF